MYETETSWLTADPSELSAAVLERFAEARNLVQQRTLLSWGEHCTECVWPSCYSTCEFYSPRPDLKCRRFAEGFVRIDFKQATNRYILRVTFKLWGKLFAPGSTRLRTLADATRLERLDLHLGKAIRLAPMPFRAKVKMARRRYVAKRDASQTIEETGSPPDAFLIECFNPEDKPADFTLVMAPNETAGKSSFQRRIVLAPGYNRIFTSFDDIRRTVDPQQPFNISLISNHAEGQVTVYFGVLDFVKHSPGWMPEQPKPVAIAKKCKCVVWDLDNTLWHGTLIEDGSDNVELNSQAVALIKALDQRGVLNSVASKNNLDDAMQVLRKFGLLEYFLYPQVSWAPKSGAISTIAKSLNLNVDTFIFVDDSAFERAEVQASHPPIRVVGVEHLEEMLAWPEFDVPVTSESASRRQMYREESVRKGLETNFDGDYLGFLRDCEITLSIRPLNVATLKRVHELSQRTNQMNFSGTRYDRDVLERILGDAAIDTYVLDCADRFGNYGTIGFCVVDAREPRMTDLMFSCRVQSKRVEHAFLAFLIDRYRSGGFAAFHADYRRTKHNAPSGKVFDDLGFDPVASVDGVINLVFPAGRELSHDGVIQLDIHERYRTCTGASSDS